jgi:uncharacterized phage protein (predicted DNA packaging)
MKWTEISYIKQHSRLDFDCEDALLELYATQAEDTILNLLHRTYTDLMDSYGDIPAPIRQATLMLVEQSYNNRGPVSPTNMSVVPYAFDQMVKPYMRLTDAGGDTTVYQTATLGSDIKIGFTAELPDELTLGDVDFTVQVVNFSQKDKSMTATKEQCIAVDEERREYAVLVDTTQLGVGVLRLVLTVQIPDTDYPSGLRRQVVNINPHVIIKG